MIKLESNIKFIFHYKSYRAKKIKYIYLIHDVFPEKAVKLNYLNSKSILYIKYENGLIHIHDIFTPKDYLDDWILNKFILWNEQYLLEAFLSSNNDFEILAALNYLTHNYFNQLSSVCPILKNEPKAEPGSFWIVKK